MTKLLRSGLVFYFLSHLHQLQAQGRVEKACIIQSGDTLSQVAAETIGRPIFTKTGTLKRLLELNPEIKDPDLILERQVIRCRPDTEGVKSDQDQIGSEDSNNAGSLVNEGQPLLAVIPNKGRSAEKTKQKSTSSIDIKKLFSRTRVIYQPMYVLNRHELAMPGQPFSLFGYTFRSLSVRMETINRSEYSLAASLNYYSYISPAADNGFFVVASNSHAVLAPELEVRKYNIFLASSIEFIPKIGLGWDATQFLNFMDNTTLVIDQSHYLKMTVGLTLRSRSLSGLLFLPHFSSAELSLVYFRQLFQMGPQTAELSANQGIYSELMLTLPIPSMDLTALIGISGRISQASVMISSDPFQQSERRLALLLGLGLGTH